MDDARLEERFADERLKLYRKEVQKLKRMEDGLIRDGLIKCRKVVTKGMKRRMHRTGRLE